MKTRVFIDGSEGTTGLRIHDRLGGRSDVELLSIAPELRKDETARKHLIDAADVVFLCLPDAAAVQSVSMASNPETKIIDASTAHRTAPGWAYGFPELSAKHRMALESSKRTAVPGCHASGFVSLVYPLVSRGVIAPDCPVSAFSLSGYSGAGKKAIAQYESENKESDLFAPREYALSQKHKHLPEMKAVTGMTREPLFVPVIDDYYSGMLVTVPLYADMLQKYKTPAALRAFFADYYAGQSLISVMPETDADQYSGFLPANRMTGLDTMRIFVTGNDDRLLCCAMFDNLGKGASGAAVQCFNIMTGAPETTGLVLG